MARLSGSVGGGGQNAPHDVALVQLMLGQVRDSKGAPFLSTFYDGRYSPALGAAIASFQTSAEVKTSSRPGASAERTGLIEAGGETLAKLGASLPAALKGIRTAAGVSVVYLDMGGVAKQASIAAILQPKKSLTPGFSAKLTKFVSDFYDQTGIVLTLQEPFGWWRSFDMQVGLASQGGPGESIHNYGRAVDIGFKGLQWVTQQGQVRGPLSGDLTAGGLDVKVQNEFWSMRFKAVQSQSGLFGTIAFDGGDKAHLQDLEDARLDSAGSLIALLESVGPRRMKWESLEMTPTSYSCDLGLGGEKVLVGTALDVWVTDPADSRWAKALREKHLNPSFKLTKADLAKALNAKMKTDAKFSLDAFLGRAGTPQKKRAPTSADAGAADPKDTSLTAADVSDADMKVFHLVLRGEFQAAAENWKKWNPVWYPDQKRRPKHKAGAGNARQ
jgi:hypothetical protein